MDFLLPGKFSCSARTDFCPAGLSPCQAGVWQQLHATAQPCQLVDNSKEEMERAKGFEPSPEKSELVDSQVFSQAGKSGYTQIRAHAAGASCPKLAKVVAVWPKLPEPLKAAILAIVNSMEGVQ